MRIGELSEKTGIPARMLRYYEEHGLITPRRLDNGYRDYDQRLVDRADKIRCFADAGVPVRAIGPLLDDAERSGGEFTPGKEEEFRALLTEAHDRMAERIARLEKDRASLAELIANLHDSECRPGSSRSHPGRVE